MLSDQELAALLEAASKGPWHGRFLPEYTARLYGEHDVAIANFGPVGSDRRKRKANARLAALAPALARKVLARREAGQEVYEALGLVMADLHRLAALSPKGTNFEPTVGASNAAQAAEQGWAELTETEVQDEQSG